MDPALEACFGASNIIVRRSNQDLGAAIDYARRIGELESVLPGIYARKDHHRFPAVRVEALRAHEPAAILIEGAAARFSFWPSLEIGDVAAAVPRRMPARTGFRFVRRAIPDHLVTEADGVRLTVPALTAIEIGAEAVDEALRTGACSLAQMRAALAALPRRPGNTVRRRLLEESSENPWSPAERQFHRLLREAGITGWRGNYPTGGEPSHTIDVAFVEQRLAIEIDGRQFHGDGRFEFDRWRQNAIVLAGWRVLRFTWRMIENDPEQVIDTVRRGLALS